jgi:hypothetical protein
MHKKDLSKPNPRTGTPKECCIKSLSINWKTILYLTNASAIPACFLPLLPGSAESSQRAFEAAVSLIGKNTIYKSPGEWFWHIYCSVTGTFDRPCPYLVFLILWIFNLLDGPKKLNLVKHNQDAIRAF